MSKDPDDNSIVLDCKVRSKNCNEILSRCGLRTQGFRIKTRRENKLFEVVECGWTPSIEGECNASSFHDCKTLVQTHTSADTVDPFDAHAHGAPDIGGD
jgi:hypothetical protein